MSFSGLPGIIAEMEKLDGVSKLTADDLKKVAEAAIKAVTEGNKVKPRQKTQEETEAEAFAKLQAQLAQQGGMHAERGKLGQSFTGVTVLEGYQYMPWGELTRPEDQAGRTDPTLSAGYTKLLEDLVKRIREAMGPDNYIAKLLENELPYLKNGARSAGEVQNFVQGVMMNLFAGLRDQLADPKTPKDTRALLTELMGLAMDARNIAKESDFANQNRAAAERKRQDEIRDLLATDRHNKTKAQLDELDKRLKELQGVQAATGQHIEAIHEYTGQTNSTVMSTRSSVEGFSKDLQAVHEYTGQANSVLSKTASTVEGISKNTEHIATDITATRSQIKEASDQAKKDAEEARKSLHQIGEDFLHGVQVPVQLTDDLERWIIAHGG